MTEPTAADDASREPLAHVGHPKGTLAVLVIYMLLFILGWAALYFGQFLPRGTPDGAPDQAAEETVHGEALSHGEAPAP